MSHVETRPQVTYNPSPVAWGKQEPIIELVEEKPAEEERTLLQQLTEPPFKVKVEPKTLTAGAVVITPFLLLGGNMLFSGRKDDANVNG